MVIMNLIIYFLNCVVCGVCTCKFVAFQMIDKRFGDSACV